MKHILLTFCLIFASPAARACEVALVIALDVSRSVDKYEYVFMRDGIGAAFLDDEVTGLIGYMPGGMMVTVTQWGGAGQQRQPIPWTHLTNRESVVTFVENLVKIDRGFWMADTSVSEALLHADHILQTQPLRCRRNIIDVSGDGISNAGPDVAPISITVGARGITINGLVVDGARPDPVSYFLTEVIRGPLSFVEIANGYDDYETAMKRKLLRELAPNLSELRNQPTRPNAALRRAKLSAGHSSDRR